jgi:2'-5' RNA ligase
MALFLAIQPAELSENPELQRLFSKFKRTLSDKGKETRWSSPHLWHVTLAFLGPVGHSQREGLLEWLERWEPTAQWRDLNLRFQGVGAFPEVDHARVLWVGVQKSQSLLDAQSELEAELRTLGFDLEDRSYQPHLTLARFRNAINVDDLVKLGGRKHFGDYKVNEILLLESVIQGNMPKYVPVFKKSLD